VRQSQFIGKEQNSYEFSYKNSLVRLLREISERLLSLSADPNIQMASIHHEYLNDVLSRWLAGITDPPRHISDALKNPQLFAHLEKGRLDQETYWEECLKKVHWEIDGPEILNAFSNDRPIEQVRLLNHYPVPVAYIRPPDLKVSTPADVCAFVPPPSSGQDVHGSLTRSTRAAVVSRQYLPSAGCHEHPGCVS
jgi:hypothetical protein